ncbi:MAG TPA: flagellar hook-basal body complex protein [Pseudorhodoplanes sp.]|nr:flagellar hook-basal body complex protein [Pseudorhodoplanes sp.]
MGIFGALTTAVTGMRAQSYALENISGNIANSQTTAFKRIDTSFIDLIPDNIPSKQLAGSVGANSRSTNTVQGDIQSSSIGTFMAINGDGFFVVQKPASFQDNQPSFEGIDLYTRRGDFQPDKNGYLVNGAGYYLMGIPVDPTTGNLVGSVPQLLQFQNDFLPAQATTQITYRANLASYPLTPSHDTDVPRSELLKGADFQKNPIAGPPQPATIAGYGATWQPDAKATGVGTVGSFTPTTTLASLSLSVGDTLTVSDGTNTTSYTVAAGDDISDILTAINSGAPGNAAVTASLDPSGHLKLVSANYLDTITVTGTAASTLGFAAGNNTFQPVNLLTQGAASQGQTFTVTVGAGLPQTITFGNAGYPAEVATLADLSAALIGLTGLSSASVDATGNITLIAGNTTDTINIASGGTNVSASNFGLHSLTALASDGTVIANDLTTFLNESIGGGAITAYDISGSPVNIQLRWAKTDSSLYGGADTWNLFYQVNSNATGQQVAWVNAGTNYVFGPNGQLNPTIANLTLTNVTVDGVSLGDIQVVHGSGGITQFADPNGNAKVNLLQQNGFAAGELQQVSVNDKGRVVGSYSNGRTIDLAEITLASFNGPNYLKRIDGGAFEVTDDSGPAVYGASGKIVGSSLEGSNTDIADEFTKLIVTQQAYSANTKVITTGNEMVQDLLNMLR